MKEITEDYVSFETAKLLKEKGFPQEYDMFHSLIYNEEDYEDEYEVDRMVTQTKVVKAGTLSSYPAGVPEPKCYCPTLQMAMKWLREVHGLHIDVFVGEDESYDADSVMVEQWHFWTYYITTTDGDFVYNAYEEFDVVEYQTYEEACEAAIKYCLEKLI